MTLDVILRQILLHELESLWAWPLISAVSQKLIITARAVQLCQSSTYFFSFYEILLFTSFLFPNFDIYLRWVQAKVLTRSGSRVEVIWRETVEKYPLYLLCSTKGFFCLKTLNHFSQGSSSQGPCPDWHLSERQISYWSCDFSVFVLFQRNPIKVYNWV